MFTRDFHPGRTGDGEVVIRVEKSFDHFAVSLVIVRAGHEAFRFTVDDRRARLSMRYNLRINLPWRGSQGLYRRIGTPAVMALSYAQLRIATICARQDSASQPFFNRVDASSPGFSPAGAAYNLLFRIVVCRSHSATPATVQHGPYYISASPSAIEVDNPSPNRPATYTPGTKWSGNASYILPAAGVGLFGHAPMSVYSVDGGFRNAPPFAVLCSGARARGCCEEQPADGGDLSCELRSRACRPGDGSDKCVMRAHSRDQLSDDHLVASIAAMIFLKSRRLSPSSTMFPASARYEVRLGVFRGRPTMVVPTLDPPRGTVAPRW